MSLDYTDRCFHLRSVAVTNALLAEPSITITIAKSNFPVSDRHTPSSTPCNAIHIMVWLNNYVVHNDKNNFHLLTVLEYKLRERLKVKGQRGPISSDLISYLGLNFLPSFEMSYRVSKFRN